MKNKCEIRPIPIDEQETTFEWTREGKVITISSSDKTFWAKAERQGYEPYKSDKVGEVEMVRWYRIPLKALTIRSRKGVTD